MHQLRSYIEAVIPLFEDFMHAFKVSYHNGICEVFKNPSRKEFNQIKGDNDEVRAFLTEDDIYIWNTFSALHQTVREELKLDKYAIPVVLYGNIGEDAAVMITDNVRHTPLYHSSFLAEPIEQNRYMIKNFTSVEISYYDEDIVGNWAANF